MRRELVMTGLDALADANEFMLVFCMLCLYPESMSEQNTAARSVLIAVRRCSRYRDFPLSRHAAGKLYKGMQPVVSPESHDSIGNVTQNKTRDQ